MKTYVLDRVASLEHAQAVLTEILPDGLLRDSDGDVIAYFNVTESDFQIVGPAITADVSGRHYNEDAAVIAVLKAMQRRIGGTIVAAP